MKNGKVRAAEVIGDYVLFAFLVGIVIAALPIAGCSTFTRAQSAPADVVEAALAALATNGETGKVK